MAEQERDFKPHLKKLDRIFGESGANSEAFFAQVKNLIILVQYRYIGFTDEDVQQNVYKRIVESLQYYDPTKANIGTWVFSVARNQCSSHNYYRKKRLKESEEPLLHIQVPDPIYDNYLEQEATDRFFESHTRVMIDPPADYYPEFLQLDSDHVLKKALLWESLIDYLRPRR